MKPPVDETDPTVEQFQSRRRSFQSRWNRTMLFVGFPGFALFVGGMFVGGPLGVGFSLIGFVMLGTAVARGLLMVKADRACPICGTPQPPSARFPFRSCEGCGARLSYGARDSW